LKGKCKDSIINSHKTQLIGFVANIMQCAACCSINRANSFHRGVAGGGKKKMGFRLFGQWALKMAFFLEYKEKTRNIIKISVIFIENRLFFRIFAIHKMVVP